MSRSVGQWVYLLALFPCAVAASLGVFATWALVQGGLGDGEYAGLAPYVVAVYYGPGFAATLAAALVGIRPGMARLILTVIAGAWSVVVAPMSWLVP